MFDKFDHPVLSLSTKGDVCNMNICANIIHISTQPKIFGLPIKKDTKTLKNLESHPYALVQLLGEEQHTLIEPLGKTSGNDKDKLEGMENIDYHNRLAYLKDCLEVMEVRVSHVVDVGGDHHMAILHVVSEHHLNEGTPLTLNYLREKGIWSEKDE